MMLRKSTGLLRLLGISIIIIANAGCAGVITCAGCGGGGGFPSLPSRNLPPRPSIPITLSFQLSATDTAQPLNEQTIKITRDRAKQFLAVGINEFSRRYGMSPAEWTISVWHSDEAPQIENEARRDTLDHALMRRLGIPELPESVTSNKSVRMDQSMHATVWSPSSASLSAATSGPSARALITSDTHYSDKREYRTTFLAFVVATYRPEIPRTLFFDVSINAYLDGKSKYADEDAFRPVKGFKQTQAATWQRMVSEDLLTSYVNALRGLGLKVTPRTH